MAGGRRPTPSGGEANRSASLEASARGHKCTLRQLLQLRELPSWNGRGGDVAVGRRPHVPMWVPQQCTVSPTTVPSAQPPTAAPPRPGPYAAGRLLHDLRREA